MISALFRAESISHFLYSRHHLLHAFLENMVMMPAIHASTEHDGQVNGSNQRCQCFTTLILAAMLS